MEFYLSQLLPLFVYPVGVLAWALPLAIFLVYIGRKRLAVTCLALLTLLVWVSGNRYIADHALYKLETVYPAYKGDDVADLIVILGGVTEQPMREWVIPEVNGGADRLIRALHMYKQGQAPKILVAGGRTDSRFPEAVRMARLLLIMGVHREDILLETRSLNTEQNAYFTKQRMINENLEKVFLVTSASHMRRASSIFEREGINHIRVPTDYNGGNAGFYTLSDMFPEGRHVAKSTRAMKEIIGYWYLLLKEKLFPPRGEPVHRNHAVLSCQSNLSDGTQELQPESVEEVEDN